MSQIRRSRATLDPAPPTTPIADTKSNAPTDDFLLDQIIVRDAGDPIWVALFNGRFRLAVQCDTCGRWLTSATSKAAHRGPRCAKAVSDV